MSPAPQVLGMDVQTVVSMAVGVVLGGLITWFASWYYAQRSSVEMKKLIDAAAKQLGNDIPKQAAQHVIANQVISNILAAGPLAFEILAKVAKAGGNTQSKASGPIPGAAGPSEARSDDPSR